MEGGNDPPADCDLADDEELKALWLACFQSIKKPAGPKETSAMDTSYIQTQTFPVRKSFGSKRRNGISLSSSSRSNLIVITPDDSNANLPHQEISFQAAQYKTKSPQGSSRKKERSRFSRYESDSTSEESEYDYEDNTVKDIIASGNQSASSPKLYGPPSKSLESSEKSYETTNLCKESSDQSSVFHNITFSSNWTANAEMCESDINLMLLSNKPENHERSHQKNYRNTCEEFNLHSVENQESNAGSVGVKCLSCSSENSYERLKYYKKNDAFHDDKNELNSQCSKNEHTQEEEKIELVAREMKGMLHNFSSGKNFGIPLNARRLISEHLAINDVKENCLGEHVKNSIASTKSGAETNTARSDFTEIQFGKNNESPKDSFGLFKFGNKTQERSWEVIFDSFTNTQCRVSKSESVVCCNTSNKALESGSKEQSQAKPSVLISETKDSIHHDQSLRIKDPVMNLVMKLADELNESMDREKNKKIEKATILDNTPNQSLDEPPQTSEESSNELIAINRQDFENLKKFSDEHSSSPDIVCLAINLKDKSSISKPMNSKNIIVSDADNYQKSRVLPSSSSDTIHMHPKKDTSEGKMQKLQSCKIYNGENHQKNRVLYTSSNTFDSYVESDTSMKRKKTLSQNDLRYALRRKIEKHPSCSYAGDYFQAHKQPVGCFASKNKLTSESQSSLTVTEGHKYQSSFHSKCVQKQKNKFYEPTISCHRNDKRSRSRSSSTSSNVSESSQKRERKRVCSVVAYASGSFENIPSNCKAAQSNSREQELNRSGFTGKCNQKRKVSSDKECFSSSCQSKVPVHMRLGPSLKSLTLNASISSTEASGQEDSEISSCDSSSDGSMYQSKKHIMSRHKERSWQHKSKYRNDQ